MTGSMSTPQKLLAAVLALLLHLPLFWHLQEGLQRGDSKVGNASQSGVTLKLAARPTAKKPATPAPVPAPAPVSKPKAVTPPPAAKPKPVLTAPTTPSEEIEPQPAEISRESSDSENQEEGSQQQQQAIGGQTMGLGGASASGKTEDELELYKGLIHSRIKQLHQYPQQARMRNQQGTVEITFTVAADGSIAALSITRSSGSPLLDRAAERLFSRLRLPPPDVTILPSLTGLTVPVKFELE